MSIDGGVYTAIRSAQRGDLIASALVRPSFDLMEARRRLVWCRNSDCAWYLYWEENHVLGWVLVSWQGKETAPKYPDMFDLYVRQDSRGRGIGTQLVYFCEEMASKWGFKKIGLAVNHTANPRALALYKRLGYRVISTAPYLDGVYEGVDDWVVDMEKALE
jgi:GNAT superfamily N-acetyltransferase